MKTRMYEGMDGYIDVWRKHLWRHVGFDEGKDGWVDG